MQIETLLYYLLMITDDEAVISNSFIHIGPRLAQQIQSHINPLNYVIDTMKSMLLLSTHSQDPC